MEIYVIEPVPKPNGWKRKMGVFGWHEDELFIPACATGMKDHAVFLLCSFDGKPVCNAEDTLLISETWARGEFPSRSAVFDAIHRTAVIERSKG